MGHRLTTLLVWCPDCPALKNTHTQVHVRNPPLALQQVDVFAAVLRLLLPSLRDFLPYDRAVRVRGVYQGGVCEAL